MAKLCDTSWNSWTLDNDVGGLGLQEHYDARPCLQGDSDRCHFFWGAYTALGSPARIVQRALNSADVLQTATTVVDANLGDDVQVDQIGVGVSASINGVQKLVVVYGGITANGKRVFIARADSADVPTWSPKAEVVSQGTLAVPDTSYDGVFSSPGSLAIHADGRVYNFWGPQSLGPYDLYYASDGGGTGVTWASATLFVAGEDMRGESVSYIYLTMR